MSIIIGLTGGIATGKSVVANLLRDQGAVIIDADQIAREVVQPGKPAFKEIVSNFGQEVLSENGELNRRALANKVFGNQEALQLLNQITHPPILDLIQLRVLEGQEAGVKAIVVDAPLLIETGLISLVDKIIVTTAPERLQIQRICERDGLSPEEALKRIKSQIPAEQRERWADYIINTNCSLPEVEAQVKVVWEEIINDQEDSPDSARPKER